MVEFQAGDIARVRGRHRDSAGNGAAIGAAVALLSSIVWFAPMTESGETGGENIAFIAKAIAAGAGAGAGVDLLIPGRKTIYLPPSSASSRLHVAPLLSASAAGARVSWRF